MPPIRRSSPVVDLHAHSTASDGTESPGELVAAAAAAGVDVLAITDHDTTSGWDEALGAATQHGVGLVRGIEISTQRDGRSIHLLGYLPDPAHSGLRSELERTRDARETRLAVMVQRLHDEAGLPLTLADVLAQVPPGATPGRPHIADALVAAGVVAHRDGAFERWLHNSSPYYVRHYAPDPTDAVRLVRAAGGVPVLAHPFGTARGTAVPDDLVEELAEAGLAGLEADHRDHDASARAHARTLAASMDLVVTGSSDYHGTGKRNLLAENTTHPEQLERIIALASGATPVVGP